MVLKMVSLWMNGFRKNQSYLVYQMVYSYAGFQFLYLAHEWSAEAMDKMSLEKVAGDFLYMPNRT